MIRFGLIIKAMRGVDIPGGDFAVKERFSFAVNFSTNAESSSIGACSMAPKFSAYTVHRGRARRLKLASSDRSKSVRVHTSTSDEYVKDARG